MLLLLAVILAIAVGGWILVSRRRTSRDRVEQMLSETGETTEHIPTSHNDKEPSDEEN